MADVSHFRRLRERPEFQGHLFSVHTVVLQDPDGEVFERAIVRHPGAVLVVPVHDDRSVTLVRQLRVAMDESVLEAPAGTCDVDGEAPAATAARELEEEAGLRAGRIVQMAVAFNSPGYTDQRTTLFLATDLEAASTQPAGPEERWMSTERVPLDTFEQLVLEGRLHDSTTIVALCMARHVIGAAPVPRSKGP